MRPADLEHRVAELEAENKKITRQLRAAQQEAESKDGVCPPWCCEHPGFAHRFSGMLPTLTMADMRVVRKR